MTEILKKRDLVPTKQYFNGAYMEETVHDISNTMNVTKCVSLHLHKPYLWNTDDVVNLQPGGLGNYNVFKFDRCSPNVKSLVQAK